ncbi:MAG: hypothetical protein ACLFVB_00485 [Thermoplasmata archaeon]
MAGKIDINIENEDIDESDQFMTMFFVFDNVVENGDMQAQMALELFKKIQKQTLQ